MRSVKFCDLELNGIYHIHRTENGEKVVTQAKYLGWHTKTCFGFKVVIVYDMLLPSGKECQLWEEEDHKSPAFFRTLADAIEGKPIEAKNVRLPRLLLFDGFERHPSRMFPGTVTFGMPAYYWDGCRPQRTLVEYFEFEYGYNKNGYYRRPLPGKEGKRKYYGSEDECRKDNIIKVYTF